MAPDFGDTQVMSPSMTPVPGPVDDANIVSDERPLPSMDDLDSIVVELDRIDATLADLR